MVNHVGFPDDLTLPFFAYEIFKPGQLSYHRIKKYVNGNPSAEIINHEMQYRDFFAFIIGEENEKFKTIGYIIEFTNPHIAYKRIGKSKPENLYEWKVIKVNGKEANALVGLDTDCGSFDNHDSDISTYDYRQDYYFNEGLESIEDTIKKLKDNDIKNIGEFFELQSQYMTLWSIIERFCTLSYGYFNIGSNMFNFARQKEFRKTLKHDIGREDVVYSSDELEDKHLDPDSYRKSIKYYYTIRCNVVHRGKAATDKDKNKLKKSLEELYILFMAVYNEKMIENNELLEKYPEKKSL